MADAQLAALLTSPPDGLTVTVSPGRVVIQRPADQQNQRALLIFVTLALLALCGGVAVSMGSWLPLLGTLGAAALAPLLLSTETITLTPHAVVRSRDLWGWRRRSLEIPLSDILAMAPIVFLERPGDAPIKRLQLSVRDAARPEQLGHAWPDAELAWLRGVLEAAQPVAGGGAATDIPAALRALSAHAEQPKT